MRNIFLLLVMLFACYAGSLQAQMFGSPTEIYNRNGVRVSIAFRTSQNSCDQGGKTHKYRFNIEGNLHSYKKELKVTIKYLNCQNREIVQTTLIDIGTGGSVGINESGDYTLTGDISEKEVKAEDNSAPQQTAQPVYRPNPTPNPTTTYNPPSTQPSLTTVNVAKRKKYIGMNVAIGAGFDFGSRPMVATYRSTSNQTSSLTGFTETFNSTSQKLINPAATGLRGDFMFHPLHRSWLHLGVFVGGAYGISPAMLGGGTVKSKSTDVQGTFIDKTKYNYHKFDVGVDYAIGGRGFKFLIRYINSFQEHNYSFVRNLSYTSFEPSLGSSTLRTDVIEETGFAGLRRETFQLGFRISGKRGAKIGRNKRSAPAEVDMFYNISRDNRWSWKDKSARSAAKSDEIQFLGGGMTINIGRLIYISGEFAYQPIKPSKLSSEIVPPKKSKNLYTQFTLAYNFSHSF